MSDQNPTGRPENNAPVSIEVALHLAAITREAAARAYDADSGIAGKLAIQLITALATLNASGLVLSVQDPDKLARTFPAQVSLLIGLLATILGGVFEMTHHNALADRWRLEMYFEIEGAADISHETVRL